MNDINRAHRNRDYLKRLNYPRATYAFSGIDWGDADIPQRVRGKLNINGAPMIITPLPPGANASNDIAWADTYGASMDCVMSIVDGNQFNDNILSANAEFSGPFFKSLPHARNTNLIEPIDGKQQIHFVAGADTVKQARDLAKAQQPMEAFEIRGLGMRSPMQMCGWGKTITMRPTDPDPADFRENDNEHKFDRSTWEIGPVDLRWDGRRKMWRGWNDLITDDGGQGLGTFVFSTNDDDSCGFPFLRGKLEDVWSVRHTSDEVGKFPSARGDDSTQTAKVMTKIDSYAFDKDQEFAAKWTDVLKIFNECVNNPPSAFCGTESMTFAQMGILSTANFYANPNFIGPIVFSIAPPSDKTITGQMYYEDAGTCGQWVPGIDIDICAIGASEFGTTFDNDKILLDGIIDLCTALTGGKGPKDLLELIRRNRTWIRTNTDLDIKNTIDTKEIGINSSAAFDAIQGWTEAIVASINTEMATTTSAIALSIMASVQAALTTLQTQILECVNEGFAFIAQQLAENCNCEIVPPICDAPGITLNPAMGIRPKVRPTLSLDTFIQAIEGVSQDLEETVQQGQTDLLLEIDKTISDDEIEEEDQPEPIISLEITNPCDPKKKESGNC